jgi:hypothetical protein
LEHFRNATSKIRIPIGLQHATINGFRVFLPANVPVRPRGADPPANDDGNRANEQHHGIRIENILPREGLGDDEGGPIPQVINNPDGTFSINIGNIENFAAGAAQVNLGDVEVEAAPGIDNHHEGMFGLARAAMEAAFGFNHTTENDHGPPPPPNAANRGNNPHIPPAGTNLENIDFQGWLERNHGDFVQGNAVFAAAFPFLQEGHLHPVNDPFQDSDDDDDAEEMYAM